MMSEVLSIFILLTEELMILQCLQIVFKQELAFDKYMVGIIGINSIIYMGINLKILPMICSFFFYILTYVFCLIKFKQTKVKTAVRMIIAFSLVGCIEGIIVLITNILAINIFKEDNSSSMILVVSSYIALTIAYIIKKRVLVRHSKLHFAYYNTMHILVSFSGILFVIVLTEYYTNSSDLNLYIVFILFFLILIFVYLYRLEQAHNEIVKKNYELELNNIYGGAYEKLLSEVRRRQHDYKNQLGAIYSMHLTAGSLEELVTMQTEYADTLLTDCKFDAILTGCENQILAGYLYYKCIDCEQKEIAIEYNIHMGETDCNFFIHEVIELLGILIDNACESVGDKDNESKLIRLDLQEDEERILFSVSNPADYISFSQIERMFVLGYSSKGENRGLGLPRVKELVDKHGANLKVTNFMCKSENWIDFRIEIEKTKGA